MYVHKVFQYFDRQICCTLDHFAKWVVIVACVGSFPRLAYKNQFSKSERFLSYRNVSYNNFHTFFVYEFFVYPQYINLCIKTQIYSCKYSGFGTGSGTWYPETDSYQWSKQGCCYKFLNMLAIGKQRFFVYDRTQGKMDFREIKI
jgi:hypothetical protein